MEGSTERASNVVKMALVNQRILGVSTYTHFETQDISSPTLHGNITTYRRCRVGTLRLVPLAYVLIFVIASDGFVMPTTAQLLVIHVTKKLLKLNRIRSIILSLLLITS